MHYINYHESKQRGTLDFPLEFYHVTKTHPQYYMRIHWHVEFEFIRVLEGNLLLTLDEQEMNITKNSVVFIPSGTLHTAVPENDCVYDCIVMDANMLMNKSDSCCKFIHQIMNHELDIRSFYDESYHDICQTVWTLFDAIASKYTGYQLIAQGALYQFFGMAISQNYHSELTSRSPRTIKRIMQLKQALEFIESSYTSAVTLQDISSSVHMSPKYFCRFFHEMTHRSPIDYLNYYRIERACYLLLTTNQTITEVAYNTGFNDLSYFIKTFKRYKGITPKQYLLT